jgi:Cu(I)/Ag(I) efflux system membrane protein CusA/SilA
MLVYLDNALKQWQAEGRLQSRDDLKAAIEEGAVLRIRPKAMTVATIFAGLLPIMLQGGVGSEVMQPIAAPMVGGMITAPLLSLFVLPAIYLLWRQRALSHGESPAPLPADTAEPDPGSSPTAQGTPSPASG